MSVPAHGTTLSATGAANGESSASPRARRTSPGLVPSSVPADHRQPFAQRHDAVAARAAHCLVRGDDELPQPEFGMQRTDGDDQRQRGAVGARDDAARPDPYGMGVDLGHDQRHVRVHPVRRRVVDDDDTLGRGDRCPSCGHVVGHQEEGHVHVVEHVLGEFDDFGLLAAYDQLAADRARRGDQRHIAPDVRVLRKDLEHDAADRPGRSDDRERRAARCHRPVPP